MARAFHGDPAWEWIFPTPTRRAAVLPYLFERALRLESLRGHMHAVDGAGVAIWIPPSARRPTFAQTVRSGIAFVPLRLLPAERLRLRRYLAACAQLQRRDLAGAWYLSGLAVDPARQREGIGSSLVRWGVERGRAGLLTSKPENVQFYERRGFHLVGEWWNRDGPPHMWAMLSE